MKLKGIIGPLAFVGAPVGIEAIMDQIVVTVAGEANFGGVSLVSHFKPVVVVTVWFDPVSPPGAAVPANLVGERRVIGVVDRKHIENARIAGRRSAGRRSASRRSAR